MDLYKAFLTNSTLENEGVRVDYGSDTYFRITRMGPSNQRYQRGLAKLQKSQAKVLESGTLDAEEQRKILLALFLDHILLDWEGVKDREGNLLEFSREAAEKLFTDLPELFDDLQSQATNRALFLETETEETGKN